MSMITDERLNASQLKFYDDYMRNPSASVGNVARMYKLSKNVDAPRFADAISKAINNHKAFSLRFYKDGNGEPRQHILENAKFHQKVEHMTDEELEAAKSTITESFNFFDTPLFNSRVIETPSAVYWFIDTHHTIRDANAFLVLVEDVNHAYNGEPMEPECWSPCDVAGFEYDFADSIECGKSVDKLKDLWKDCQGCFPPADIDEGEYAILMHTVPLGVDLSLMAEFTKRTGCPLSVLSAAVCSLLLAHETGERDVALVTAFNCRDKEEVRRTMSMVTRYLLFNVQWDKDMPVSDFLNHAQQNGKTGRDNAYANLIAMKETSKDFSDFMPFVFQGNMMSKIMSPVLCGEQAVNVPLSRKGGYIKPFNIHFIFSNGTANLMFLCHRNRYSVNYLNRFAKTYESMMNRIMTVSTVGELLADHVCR